MKLRNNGIVRTWKERVVRSLAVSRRAVSVTYGRHRALKWFLVGLVTLSVVPASLEENALHPLLLLMLPLAAAALLRADYGKAFFWSEAAFTALFIAYVPAYLYYLKSLNEPLTPPLFLVYFTFGTVMVRCLSPLTDRNLAQLIALSAGLVLINCIISNHLVFGLLLPFYLFCLMGTLLLFHVARAAAAWGVTDQLPAMEAVVPALRGRLEKSLLFVIVLAVALFVVLPRPFAVFPGLRGGMAGGARIDLSPTISYSDMVSMMGRSRIAFAVKFEDRIPPPPQYWRGRVLEKTDGTSWYSEGLRWPSGRLIKPGAAEEFAYVVMPYRLQSKIVYACDTPVRVLGRGGRNIGINARGEVIIRSVHLINDSYYVEAAAAPIPVSRRGEPENTDQAGVTARIRSLAIQWTRTAARPRDKAEAIMTRLRSGYTYRLQTPPPPDDVHPLEHFLFTTRTGNCEYFAGATVLMLRALNIPSRVVEGFLGMENTAVEDEFIVRFARAHAWVEADLGDGVWSTLDPTPPGAVDPQSGMWSRLMDAYDTVQYQWIRGVVNFDRSNQIMLSDAVKRLVTGRISLPLPVLSNTRDLLLAIALVVGVGLVIFRFARKRKIMRTDAAAVYLATMRELVRLGTLREVHLWHEENLAEVSEALPEARDALANFVDAYLTLRFGGGGKQSWDALHAARAELLRHAALAKKRVKHAA